MAIGQVLDRPTGAPAALWRRWADGVNLQQQAAKKQREARKAAARIPKQNDIDPVLP